MPESPEIIAAINDIIWEAKNIMTAAAEKRGVKYASVAEDTTLPKILVMWTL